MQSFIHTFPARPLTWTALLLILSLGPEARAAGGAIQICCSPRDLAFARYVTSQQQRGPFPAAGPIAISIEASLPDLYKAASLVAVYTPGGNQGGELRVLQIAGDGTVGEEVIDRYFALRERFDALPSLAVTPANYKFHFAGEVKAGDATAYIYNVRPKKNRPGAVAGQLWMDSGSGREILLAGHLSDVPATVKRIDIVRDTKLLNGSAYGRVTHVAFSIPHLGRAELEITEVILPPQVPSQSQ